MPQREIYPTATAFMPAKLTLPSLLNAARTCQGCDLYKRATQTVFGHGAPDARIIFVGEQPGDSEDKAGKPFVGPAGRILEEAMQSAGIDPEQTYITNAVKHFKWEPRGKKRIHSKPSSRQIQACMPWLDAEINLIRPDLVVALGATAAQAIMGLNFKVTQSRGAILASPKGHPLLATVHPSSLLRIPDREQRHQALNLFTADLTTAANYLQKSARRA